MYVCTYFTFLYIYNVSYIMFMYFGCVCVCVCVFILPSSFSQVQSTSFPLLVMTYLCLLACSVPPFTAAVEVLCFIFCL